MELCWAQQGVTRQSVAPSFYREAHQHGSTGCALRPVPSPSVPPSAAPAPCALPRTCRAPPRFAAFCLRFAAVPDCEHRVPVCPQDLGGTKEDGMRSEEAEAGPAHADYRVKGDAEAEEGWDKARRAASAQPCAIPAPLLQFKRPHRGVG